MNNFDLLTNDAKFLLGSMYKLYVERRKSGQNKEQAVFFKDYLWVKENIMNQWSDDDVLFTCEELKEMKLINATRADDALYNISLTTIAIASLEIKFSDRLDSVLDFLAKIKNAIPFL